jgi:hypothetical protein
VCSIFWAFVVLALVVPSFPLRKLQDIGYMMSLNTETSQQLTVIVDKLACIQEAVKYLSVQLTLLQLSTKEEGRPFMSSGQMTAYRPCLQRKQTRIPPLILQIKKDYLVMGSDYIDLKVDNLIICIGRRGESNRGIV